MLTCGDEVPCPSRVPVTTRMEYYMPEIESQSNDESKESKQLPVDLPEETESALKPLLWLLVPFVLLMLYGGLT